MPRLLLILLALLTTPSNAICQASEQTQSHVIAVESGLLPAVMLTGKPRDPEISSTR
jgi:hypothetical protein